MSRCAALAATLVIAVSSLAHSDQSDPDPVTSVVAGSAGSGEVTVSFTVPADAAYGGAAIVRAEDPISPFDFTILNGLLPPPGTSGPDGTIIGHIWTLCSSQVLFEM